MMDNFEAVELVQEDPNRIALRNEQGAILHILNFNEGHVTLEHLEKAIALRKEHLAKKPVAKPRKSKAKKK